MDKCLKLKGLVAIFCILAFFACKKNASDKSESFELQVGKAKKYLLPKKEGFQSISLPFSMREYVIDLERDSHYLSYEPSEFLLNYLISIDYEGEEYRCFILPIENENLVLLTYIIRGDSEFYFLMLLNPKEVIVYKMIGRGGDNAVLFVINKDFTIDSYDADDKNKNSKKILIQGDKIVVIQK
jgi:hypothetical protein